jgi:chromosomal replication initiation ATPase DnaA
VGGGLIQSQEGGKEKEPEGEGFYDKRVLGETEFVKQILQRRQDIPKTRPLRMTWQELLEKVSQCSNVPTAELLSRTKRAPVARARSIVSYLAVRSLGMKTTQVAGLLNLTQPAVSRSLLRGEEILKESEEFGELLRKL